MSTIRTHGVASAADPSSASAYMPSTQTMLGLGGLGVAVIGLHFANKADTRGKEAHA